MNKHAGVWEIESVQMITHKGEEVVSSLSIEDGGVIELVDNNNSHGSVCKYNLTQNYESKAIKNIANSDTKLDPYVGICSWYPDRRVYDRFTIEEDGYYYTHFIIFTVKKLKKNQEEWYYYETSIDSTGAELVYKEIYTVRRTAKSHSD
jgi:hypothetical protein